MATIPRDRIADSSLAFLADPYRFIGRRARRLRCDVFATRLLGQRTLCMYGRDAAELFYDTTRMQRARAMPRRVVKTLLGAGGVQSLDGDAHRRRKRLFLSIAHDGLDRLLVIAARQWHAHARRWQSAGEVRLYHGAADVLASAACEWAGIPPGDGEHPGRIRDLVALFDGAGAVGPRHWKARMARGRAERWFAGEIERVRRDPGGLDPALPLVRVARYLGQDGQPLPARVAAVELLNLVRPIAAVSVYVVFAAHALHCHPRQREHLDDSDGDALDHFVDEVRRFYPFFPAVAARTCRSFTWHGLDFPADTRVMFDLYGTNHDPRLWARPDRFDPRRFEAPFDERFALVPQGGGVHAHGHRCPGEWITRALMRQASAFLVSGLDYAVEGRPGVDFARLPALPRGGMVLHRIRRR